jgi:crossover junction endodeoxyribonuclease RuvC
MKILGIDPGLTKVGWGLILTGLPKITYLASGIIITDASDALPMRLASIDRALRTILEDATPDRVALEEVFVNMNARSSLKLAYARGAIMSLLGQYGCDYYEYLPNQIKKAIVGVGHADKEQVGHMVRRIISGIDSNKKLTPDESDALAIAYSCSVYN